MGKHSRVTAASFTAVLSPLAVLGPLAGFAASLAGATLARGGDVQFTEHVISTAADNANSVFATDVDGDGDTDVLSASWRDNKIAWYESDGGSPPIFTEWVISTSANGAFSVFATDVDGDGDTDVLSASFRDDKIAWYENDGGSPPTFTERVISTAADQPLSVFATDVDGDGDTDVLSASVLDDKIAWYESDGGSPPTFIERVISTAADGAISVFATDVDGDGDIDVLSASALDDKIAWYESDGASPPSFTERVISTAADRAWSVFATDVDGDGDTDVLSASVFDDKIAWYESDGGSPPTFTERVITEDPDGLVGFLQGFANEARSVFATDVDGDGDTDVLSASASDDKIAWYESDGGSPPTFTERMISTTANGAESVFAVDMDGDGDTDVLSASFADDKIAWYENTTCGDGVVEGAEECDDGGESAMCDADCTADECGDGTRNVTAGEECDDEGESATCDADCTVAQCGDGTHNVTAGEECDDGLDNSDTEPDACRTDCTAPSCGDRVIDTGEECDDGNLDDGDFCSGQCLFEGACCDRSPGVGGSCSVTIQDTCVGIQLVWSPGVLCSETLCEEATGSCCNSDAGPLATQGICTGNVLQSDCDCEACTWTKGALCSNVDCPADVVSIPAVSEWGLIITTLLFLIGSKMVWRRRTTQV